ncbi:MAG: type IV pilus modification protein PilV [Nitrospirae bacterium]|nr:MAG: type IV pilus modification protein PilV [Nitrospirota bacterium]
MRPGKLNTKRSKLKTPVSQGGFTLIEVMLAMLLLTVGLLAIAGMVEMSLGRNVDANEISLATNLASDVIERIQFNRQNVTAYNGALNSGIDTLNSATRPPATQPMARGDYDQWSARLAASGLRNVRGVVTVSATGPTVPSLNQSQVTVQVNWSSTIRTRTLVVSTVVAPE